MSSTQSISGIISGLDTTSIVTSLMNLAAQPQTLLSTKKAHLSTLVSSLQSLNTNVAALGTAATTAATASSWQTLAGTSSDSSVTATVDGTASATNLSFTVDKVAQSQVSLTGSFASLADLKAGGTSLTITPTTGTAKTIDISSAGSIADVAASINGADAGITASVVKSGTSYRLQLTGASSGADNGFTVAASGGSGTSPFSALTTARSAQDAQITLWPGSDASSTVTSSTNTFDDLITGVGVTVSKVTGTADDPVNLDVAADTTSISKMVSSLVDGLNTVVNAITKGTTSTSGTDTSGDTVITPGTLSGDSAVLSLSQSVAQAGSYDINGVSPSSVGITINQDGTFTFDSTKFASAYTADPTKTQAFVTALSNRVSAVATETSDQYTGTLTQEISDDNTQVTNLGNQISDWDTKLADQKSALEAKFNAMESALSKLQSQSSALSSFLGTSTSSSSSTKTSSS